MFTNQVILQELEKAEGEVAAELIALEECPTKEPKHMMIALERMKKKWRQLKKSGHRSAGKKLLDEWMEAEFVFYGVKSHSCSK